jgi:nitric oxide synthase oxygenase domain/subunit
MTLLSWGSGRNRIDAIEQAKKNAVKDVLLKGIIGGKSGCEVRPLLSVVNAEEKYENYLATFFQDGGEYKNFVDQRDERFKDKIIRYRQKGRRDRTFSVVVNVDRLKLKERLKTDSIL